MCIFLLRVLRTYNKLHIEWVGEWKEEQSARLESHVDERAPSVRRAECIVAIGAGAGTGRVHHLAAALSDARHGRLLLRGDERVRETRGDGGGETRLVQRREPEQRGLHAAEHCAHREPAATATALPQLRRRVRCVARRWAILDVRVGQLALHIHRVQRSSRLRK